MPRGYALEQRLARAARIRARLREARKDPNVIIVGNRNVFVRQQKTVVCENAGCGKQFSFMMTTKRHKFCPECKISRGKIRDVGRIRSRGPRKQPTKMIPYAGYDGSET
jgi:hypothetical protein